jgi:hypothetical protein
MFSGACGERYAGLTSVLLALTCYDRQRASLSLEVQLKHREYCNNTKSNY